MIERESRMVEREPGLFKTLDPYTRQRQVMASAVIFKMHGWREWQIGHAKLYGILLWHYENRKQISFKYNNVLHKAGYRRTHNYRLLKVIIEKEMLQRQGNGYYRFKNSDTRLINKVLSLIKALDTVEDEAEVKRK